MGSYSVICSISGTPVEFFNEVVGLELERYRFPDERSAYVPVSWPVFGEYDTYGGIENESLSPDCALIRREVWENAELYWHVENRKCGRNFLDFKSILAEAHKGEESDKMLREIGLERDYQWTLADHVWYALEKQLSKTDEGLTLRDMLYGENYNVTNVPEGLSFLERSWFGELLVQKTITGWTAEDADTLWRLVCLWSGQMLTGRQIVPSIRVSIEQCPLYKQRVKIAQFHVNLLKSSAKTWKGFNKDRKV